MIKTLRLKNFTCFSENVFDFSAGINVFIGENSTGKTHLLKVMSAVLKAQEKSDSNLKEQITALLLGYFKPENLGRLVKRTQGRSKAEVELHTTHSHLCFDFATNAKQIGIKEQQKSEETLSLYLPAREIISIFEGFIALYQNRELSFDETYYRLALALDLPVLKGNRLAEVQNLLKPLEDITGSKVIKENGKFYLRNTQGKMEMALVAEGYRKIATLMHLIANGEIAQNSVLFWDEPEANLNPKLTNIIATLLQKLAEKGVQIFIATHDYLLTHLLSLQAEYNVIAANQLKFFALYPQNQEIACESGAFLSDLSQNPILDEFAKYYDLEQTYFNQSLRS
jgi:predicted ATPase